MFNEVSCLDIQSALFFPGKFHRRHRSSGEREALNFNMLTFFVLGLSFVLLIVFYIRYPDATIRFVKAVGPILVSLAIAYVGWIYSEAIENNIMGYGESDTRAKPDRSGYPLISNDFHCQRGFAERAMGKNNANC